MKILALALLFLLVAVTETRVFQKCELARMMKEQGLDGYAGYSLGHWLCMAYHESNFNSRSVGTPNRDGSEDYGIFQINSRWWCSNGRGRTVNACRTSCSSFIDDDITDDIECAKRIVRDPNKMGAWVAWNNHCRGTNVSKWTAGCRL